MLFRSWGLYDMVGNLWEWTRSAWRDSYRDPDLTESSRGQSADVSRLVRGGSWSSIRYGARCAAHGGVHTHGHGDNLGFRVVLRSSAVLPLGIGPTQRSAPRRRSGL